MKYRILEIQMSTGATIWKIQGRMRILWIGPKTWETYYDEIDDTYGIQRRWSWWLSRGKEFLSRESAMNTLEHILTENRKKNRRISKITVHEYKEKQP